MRIGAVDVFRRASSISRTARGGRTFAVMVRMSDALEHDVARGGPLWAEAPVQGTSARSRTVAVNAREVARAVITYPRPAAGGGDATRPPSVGTEQVVVSAGNGCPVSPVSPSTLSVNSVRLR